MGDLLWSGSSDAGELVSDSWLSQGRLGSLDGCVTFLERREGVKGGRFPLLRPIQFDPIAVADFSGRSHGGRPAFEARSLITLAAPVGALEVERVLGLPGD